jgi:ElaB/YqjD/DUF883 family membrane-anchored ribosome-binding protein
LKTLELNTNDTLLNSISPLYSSLSTLVEEYEGVLVSISHRLPKFEGKIRSNIQEATNIINSLFSQDSNNTNNEFEIKVFYDELENALQMLRLTEQEDHKNFNEIKSTIGISSEAIKKMENVFNISEDLKVFAINSIIYSNKAGENGRGYQIISSEFIKLSEKIAAGSKNISKLGLHLNSLMSSLISLFQEHEKFTHEHIATIASDTKSFLANANTNIKQFLDILDKHLNHIKEIQDPTEHIMVEIQRQDIIHQQLVHLLDTLKDLEQLVKTQ